MGEIVQIVSQQAVEDAWEAFRAHAAKGLDDPKLAVDRAYMTERRRLERRFNQMLDRIDA